MLAAMLRVLLYPELLLPWTRTLMPDSFPSVNLPPLHDDPPSPRFGAFGGDDFKFDL